MTAPVAITIGNFDGVHRGHAALLRRARELVGPSMSGGRVVAIALDPHPNSLLRPEETPGRLTSFERRATLLGELGADEVVRLEPTPELLGLSPREFLAQIVHRHRPSLIVEGPDFHFGKGRAGDTDALSALGHELGFDVEIVESVKVDLDDQTLVTVSSTMTRWLIERGRIADAKRLLGRPYDLEGVVIQGDQRGREIGFPTANLDTSCLLPADGIYAGWAHLPSGRALAAAIHVGARPTFDEPVRTVEAFILDWSVPANDGVLQEYGWRLRLSFGAWLRDQVRFESIDQLVAQIGRDVERTRQFTSAASHANHTIIFEEATA